MHNIVFFDFEVSENNQRIKDIGAKKNNQSFHSGSIHSFTLLRPVTLTSSCFSTLGSHSMRVQPYSGCDKRLHIACSISSSLIKAFIGYFKLTFQKPVLLLPTRSIRPLSRSELMIFLMPPNERPVSALSSSRVRWPLS